MAATTDQEARFLDLTTGILEMVRDGDRDIAEVTAILQVIKDHRDFTSRLLVQGAAPTPSLLEVLGTAVIPATTAPFVARDAFVVTTSRPMQANIAWMGNNFREWFLDKIEEPMSETALRYAKLSKASLDAPILEELDEFKETTLGQIFYLMSCQANGEEGVLLTDGWANVFYALDVFGALRAVRVYRRHDGWYVHASPVDAPFKWIAERRFFSRNSSVPVSV